MKYCPKCETEYADDVLFCPRDGGSLKALHPTGDLIGQIVADRYHITKKLGEGGMGAVYLAEHVKMGRKSAIKVMSTGMSSDPDAVSRFNREAANASRITHPNVCAIYDFGETGDGQLYLAMELIDGKALTDLLRETGPLPLPRAADILTQCADALQAAHDLGIVHRDLKPDNIMIVPGRGRDIVKVVDFGIAKAMGGEDGGQKVTKTGLVVGTPEYMSPEQLSGDKLDGRSDIYSLALVFFRMVTGTLPFVAESAQETMIKRLTDDPLPLAAAKPDGRFPPALQVAMDHALARYPQERYGSAVEFARDVKRSIGAPVGDVDTEGATRMVQAPAGAATRLAIPPTRVERRSEDGELAPPPGTPMARKRSVLLPVVGGVVVVALGAAVAFKDRLAPRSATLADTAVAATARTSGKTPGNAAGIPAPTPASGGASKPASSTGNPTTSKPAAPLVDQATIQRELEALDNQVLGDSSTQADWIAARPKAEAIYNRAEVPAALRAHAAQIAGQAYLQLGDNPGARRWYAQAIQLVPNPSWQKILDRIPN